VDQPHVPQTPSSHAVAEAPDGSFVEAWAAKDGDQQGIFACLSDPDAGLQLLAFQINQFTTGAQDMPSVAMDARGDFVIAWQSFGQDSSGSYGIFARRYNAAGKPLGGEFQVNQFVTENQSNSSVAMDARGDFVIAWQSFGQDG